MGGFGTSVGWLWLAELLRCACLVHFDPGTEIQSNSHVMKSEFNLINPSDTSQWSGFTVCSVWLFTLTGCMAPWPCAKSDQSGWSGLDL